VNKLLYKPLSLATGVLGGVIAGALFKQVWKHVADEEDPPDATDQDYGWGEVLVAAALQGAIFALVKAAVDRGGAVGVRKLTGSWPD
jgi:predicted metal-dependent enzyme (double-stranded beta helix superfamily)